ncbi:hypothetical protein D3C72_1592370 [compost metagenome]
MPGPPRLALRVGVGKLHVVGLDGNAVSLELPAHIGAEAVQRQDGVFENPWQYQCARSHGQRGLAARLRHVDVHRGAPQAQMRGGHPGALGRVACQRQALNASPHLVLLQAVERAFPGGLYFVHQPLGRVGPHGIVRGRAQWQPAGDLGQCSQVQPVGAQLALLRGLARRRGVHQPQIAAGPDQTVVRFELQGLRGELKPTIESPPAQSPLDVGQDQGLQLGRERGVHIGQR